MRDPALDATPDFFEAVEPFALFEAWLADAGLTEPNDPNAMALATADADGLPNVRMVLLKGLDDAAHGTDRGFVFYTNRGSAKGQELLASGKAALLFHWKSLRRQVRIRGAVSAVTPAEADAYYASRPHGSRIGAWASQQSQALESRAVLEAEVARLAAQYPTDVPRPPHWSGFRVTPLAVEFWHDRPYRLHDRLLLTRTTVGEPWSAARLYP